MNKTKQLIAGVTVLASLNMMTPAVGADGPRYKPSSRSPEPIDITSNAYGGSPLAPSAVGIAEVAPDFDLAVSGGGQYKLSDANKPVAIVFYRGHW